MFEPLPLLETLALIYLGIVLIPTAIVYCIISYELYKDEKEKEKNIWQ